MIDFQKLKNDNAKLKERFDKLQKAFETLGEYDSFAQLDFMKEFDTIITIAIDELKEVSEFSELIRAERLTDELVFSLFPNLDRDVFKEVVSSIVVQFNGFIRGEYERYGFQEIDSSIFFKFGLRAYLVELDNQAFLKLGNYSIGAGNINFIEATLAYLEQFLIFRQLLTDLDETLAVDKSLRFR